MNFKKWVKSLIQSTGYNGAHTVYKFKSVFGILWHLPRGVLKYTLDYFTKQSTLNKVQTFWEIQKIWKILPHGFEKSAGLLSKCQVHEEVFLQIMCVSQKVWTLRRRNCITKIIPNIFWQYRQYGSTSKHTFVIICPLSVLNAHWLAVATRTSLVILVQDETRVEKGTESYYKRKCKFCPWAKSWDDWHESAAAAAFTPQGHFSTHHPEDPHVSSTE